MGANRFYDFLLIHKYLGINDMISLEHDPVMHARAEFNCPYKFIEVSSQISGDFINNDTSDKKTIYWFDYDGAINRSITDDIISLSQKLRAGEFLFVTVFAGCPSYLEKFSDRERLEWVQDKFGEFANDVELDDVQKSKFSSTIHKILYSAFQFAFAYSDDVFFPFFQIKYQDTTPMMTVGGGLLTEQNKIDLNTLIKAELPFLETEKARLYKLKAPNLTEKERALFDLAATTSRKVSKEKIFSRK